MNVYSCISYFLISSTLLIAHECNGSEKEANKVSVEYVVKILDADPDGVWREGRELIKVGPSAFDAYEIMMSNPKISAQHLERILYVISNVNADRDRFKEQVVRCMIHNSPYVRLNSALLLGKIGSNRDTAPLVALLSDEDTVVANGAAESLSLLGGWEDLIAFDAWLRAATAKNLDADYLKGLRTHRQHLYARLKDAPKAKDRVPFPQKPYDKNHDATP